MANDSISKNLDRIMGYKQLLSMVKSPYLKSSFEAHKRIKKHVTIKKNTS